MTGWMAPPAARSRAGCVFSAAAAAGRLRLQRCRECDRVTYPAREACPACWSAALEWVDVADGGSLLTESTLHASFNGWFQARLPWRIATIALDAGPAVLAHVHEAVVPGGRVRVIARTDPSGQGVLVALPESGEQNMTDDPKLRSLSCDPHGRTILVTDIGSAVGQAVAAALVRAGAVRVYGGCASGAAPALESVEALPLNLSDDASVARQAAAIGAALDIVVHTGGRLRPGARLTDADPGAAREDMATNYFGLLRAVRAFVPLLRERAPEPGAPMRAWVNLLSIHALNGASGFGTAAASQAAALSLSQTLRAELAGSGIRVVDVFAGLLDDAANADLPPPKVRPAQLAGAVVTALQEGLERMTVGPIAEDLMQRFEEEPMAFEREQLRS